MPRPERERPLEQPVAQHHDPLGLDVAHRHGLLERDGERRGCRPRRGCRCAPGAPARHRGRWGRAGRRGGPGGRRRPTGPPILWRAHRHQVGAALVEAHREVGDGLHGVGVERDAVLARDGGELGDRLHRADLVVGPHDAGHGDAVGRSSASRRSSTRDVAAAVGLEPGDRAPRGPRRGTRPGRARRGARCRSTTSRSRAGSAARRASQAPLTARLSASVPPEVKTTSDGRAPSAARDPLARLLDHGAGGAAGGVQRGGVADPADCSIRASTAAGSIGVVAAWSR